MRGVEGLWDPERERGKGGWVLDKVAGVLKKKRKNQRDTVKGRARFPLFFTVLFLLAVSFTIVSSLPTVFLFYRFPRPSQDCVSQSN